MSLSAFIIVKNEAADLPACLASLQGLADEIIVVDSGSSDSTLEIAKAAGAKTFVRAFDHFSAQKQYALDQCTAEWVLSIDADERVSPALAVELRHAMGWDSAEGYFLRREMFFLGRRLRWGGVGTDWPLRFFHRAKGRFTQALVHERIEIDGRVGQLDGALEHYSYATLEEYQAKCDHYTSLAAQDLYKKGRRFSVFDHLRPAWELFQRVLIKSAWLDGQAGLIYAALSAHAAWLRAVKLWEIQKKS